MKHIGTTALVAAMLMLGHAAHAGDGSALVIAAGQGAQGPAARMKVSADYVVVPLNIQNDSKDPLRRNDEIEKAFRAIAAKLAPHPDLKAISGVVSLSPRQQSKSFGSSESYGGSAQLYVLGSLRQDTQIFAVTKRIYQLVATMAWSDGTTITLGNTALGLEDPEKYRGQLLNLIGKSVAEAKKSLGPVGLVEVDGLENPVTVLQSNDREVLLFINYRLRLQARP
jgi:hypothetical protein